MSMAPVIVRAKVGGFTLVEMSIVLIIVGLLILTIFPALTVMRQSGQRAMTQSNLQSLLTATAAYVQANGCLPCPTPATITNLPGQCFGCVRGDTVPKACNGCAVAEGIPPFVSLGVSANVAHDGWGHWMTMRVDPALTAVAFGTAVPPTMACTSADVTANVPSCVINSVSQQGTSKKGLCQAGLSTTNRVKIQTPNGAAQQAAVIFVSHGSQGYGSFVADASAFLVRNNNGARLPFPSNAPACPLNPSTVYSSSNPGLAAAQCNATGANTFVNAMMMDSYDDMMVFADRNTLVGMLGGGAACQTVW